MIRLLTVLILLLPGVGWAQQGADALFDEASRFHEGRTVLQNHARAAALFAEAAEMGHAGAQNQLGKYHHAGIGVPRDQATALRWLEAAAEQGDPGHIFDLAVALENGADGSSAPEQAAVLYQRAADMGHLDAAVSLGVLYQDGRGVAQDFARARALYEDPAQQGHARAQNNLGLLYVRGNGVAQDYIRAAALFAVAADQGLQKAMTNLGVMYENGFGVPQNDETAALWYRRGGQGTAADTDLPLYDPRLAPPPQDPAAWAEVFRAAEAGDPVAQFLAGWAFVTHVDPADPVQAARWFTRAANAGHGPAMANLARLHFRGDGVVQDYVLGQMWATLALAAGVTGADSLAARSGVTLVPGQITEAQALASARTGAKTASGK